METSERSTRQNKKDGGSCGDDDSRDAGGALVEKSN